MRLIIFLRVTFFLAVFAVALGVKADGSGSCSELLPCLVLAARLDQAASSGNVAASQYWQWHREVTHGTPSSLAAEGASSPETSQHAAEVHEPLSLSGKTNADAILNYPIHTDGQL